MTTATFRENFSLCTEGFICCTHLGYDHTIGNTMKSNDSDWCTKFQSSLLNIYFRLLSLLLIHFRYGSITWSHHTSVWHRTDQICDFPPTFEIDVTQLHSVTEIAPIRANAKAIRYCVNMALKYY